MKNMKRILPLAVCVFILCGTAACGSADNADNGADQTKQDADSRDGEKNDAVNDATGGNGVLDDAVEDVTDGVDKVTDDITDGVDRAADDLTEDNGPQKDAEDSDGDNSGNDGKKTGRENSGR